MTDDTDHRLTRRATADVIEEIKIDRHGFTDEDILIQAVNADDKWVCDCGAGPFDSKADARQHLEEANRDD